MTPRRSRSSKGASEFGHRPPIPAQRAPAMGKRQQTSPTPEDTARAAVAHETTASPTGDRVKLTLTVSLSRAPAPRGSSCEAGASRSPGDPWPPGVQHDTTVCSPEP